MVLVQYFSNPSALAMELLQYRAKPAIYIITDRIRLDWYDAFDGIISTSKTALTPVH